MISELPVEIVAPAVVLLLVALRWYYGSVLLSLRFWRFWGTARRLYMPTLGKVWPASENDAHRVEQVVDTPADVGTVLHRLQQGSGRKLEVSILSGLKTDWDGNTEVASVVGYHGPKPFPGAPEWLRAKQVHVFAFRYDGVTRVCAHEEANSFRPDKWRDHLTKGPSFDARAGVDRVTEWLRRSEE
jgi:hypothetical protein